MHKTFQVGGKTFILDQDKAEAAFGAKKVINGRQTMCFNLLPLKYQWAYDLYRKMKAFGIAPTRRETREGAVPVETPNAV